MLSYVLAFASDLWSSGPCCLKKADSCVKRQQGQQRTTMPCGLYLRIVPTYFCILLKGRSTDENNYGVYYTYSSVREKEPALLAPLAPGISWHKQSLQPEPAAFLAKPATFLAKRGALQLFHSVE